MSTTGFETSQGATQKTSAEVEREVERSRDNLDRTVDALKQKMTPNELIGEVRQALGGTGEKLLAKFMEQARENPLPLAVTGVGLLWLLTSSSTSPAPGEARSFAPASRINAANAIGDKAADLAEGVQDQVRKATDAVGRAGDQAGAAAQRYGVGVEQAIMGVIDKEPLVIGALGLFVGLAIGASLPASDLENEVVGPLHDSLLEKGQTLAKQALDQAQGAAKAAYGAAKAELNPQSDAVGNA